MIDKLINLSRLNKQLVLLFFDSILIVSAILVSFSIRLGYFYFPDGNSIWLVIFAPIIAIPIFERFGLYRVIMRYIGFKSLWSIFQSTTLYALVWCVFGLLIAVEGMPRSVILMNWLLVLIAIGGSRMFGRWFLSESLYRKKIVESRSVVIYGAGSAGRQLSIALTQSVEYKPVAFIDDNIELHRQSINGIDVISRHDLDRLIDQKNVLEVLLAIPSLSRLKRNEIIHFLEPYSLLVRSLPGVSELALAR